MLDRESNENKNQKMVAVIVKQLMRTLNLYRNFRVRVLESHTDCWLDQPEPKILGPYWRRFSGSGLVAEPR